MAALPQLYLRSNNATGFRFAATSSAAKTQQTGALVS